MGKKRSQKELQSVEAFETALGEEMSVSSEFDLPMTLISARAAGGWSEETIRRALDSLRAADLVTQPDPTEILIVLPNTRTDTARVVEERLDRAVPEAVLGVAAYTRGDAAEDLLRRDRDAADAKRS